MKIKVGVFFGGKSTEHEISVISAIQAMEHLPKDKYEAVPVYISKNNEFYIGESVGRIESYTDLNTLISSSRRVIPVPTGRRLELVSWPFKRLGANVLDYIDVAFPIVHGTNVEDGTLQGFLSMLNVPYVGCDVLSSSVGMDKYVMKTVLKDNGIPVLDCRVFFANEFDSDPDAMISAVRSAFGYPVIVKPVNLGSSIGISKADSDEELFDSLESAFSYADKVLVERAVQNLKEINCAVLGDYESAEASECEEPISTGDILDFSQKYIGDDSAKGAKGGSKGGSKGMATLKRKIPAEITGEQREIIRSYAVRAFQCLGCSGVSRIDFMMDSESGEIWLNEINTIPGSLAFYLWEPVGIPYPVLLDRMIGLAMKRRRRQESITYAFDSNVLQGVKLGGSKGSKGSKV